MKKRWLLLLGAIGILIVVFFVSQREPFPFDVEGTTEIVLRSGNTGESVTITDAEEIQSIRDMLEDHFYISKEVEPMGGWTYMMIFQNDAEDALCEISIFDNGFKYHDSENDCDIAYYCIGNLGLYEYTETYDEELEPERVEFPFDLEETTEITLNSDIGGGSVTITDAKAIKNIRNMLESETYRKQEITPASGCRYRLIFQNG
ncbi:MAG: hypothetical protein Q4D42_06615, partial [Eubacteriales bacterium]|nr:hypothetical protein [Eubacteriales bacterium]